MSSVPPATQPEKERDTLESTLTKATKYIIILASVAVFGIIGIWIGMHLSVFDFNYLMTSAGQMYVYYNATHNQYYQNTANANAGYAVQISTLDTGVFGALGLLTGLYVGTSIAEHVEKRRRKATS